MESIQNWVLRLGFPYSLLNIARNFLFVFLNDSRN